MLDKKFLFCKEAFASLIIRFCVLADFSTWHSLHKKLGFKQIFKIQNQFCFVINFIFEHELFLLKCLSNNIRQLLVQILLIFLLWLHIWFSHAFKSLKFNLAQYFDTITIEFAFPFPTYFKISFAYRKLSIPIYI